MLLFFGWPLGKYVGPCGWRNTVSLSTNQKSVLLGGLIGDTIKDAVEFGGFECLPMGTHFEVGPARICDSLAGVESPRRSRNSC